MAWTTLSASTRALTGWPASAEMTALICASMMAYCDWVEEFTANQPTTTAITTVTATNSRVKRTESLTRSGRA